MKVLDLQCAHGHGFEGWFASEDDFAQQRQRDLIACPLCGDVQIQKMLSAPRLNLRSPRGEKAPETTPDAGSAAIDSSSSAASSAGKPNTSTQTPANAQAPPATPADPQAQRPDGQALEDPRQQALLLKALRHVMAHSEDVGERFADQARAMHHGDAPPRAIRGQASAEVAMELLEEGIGLLPLPALPGLKETLQ